MRDFLAARLDKLCYLLHFLHRVNLPEFMIKTGSRPRWRWVSDLLYGCPLAALADRVGGYRKAALRDEGTPWGYPARKLDHDDPWNDGMDYWGDPTDWERREYRSDAAGCWPP